MVAAPAFVPLRTINLMLASTSTKHSPTHAGVSHIEARTAVHEEVGEPADDCRMIVGPAVAVVVRVGVIAPILASRHPPAVRSPPVLPFLAGFGGVGILLKQS